MYAAPTSANTSFAISGTFPLSFSSTVISCSLVCGSSNAEGKRATYNDGATTATTLNAFAYSSDTGGFYVHYLVFGI